MLYSLFLHHYIWFQQLYEHNIYNIAHYGIVMPVSYHPLIISIDSSKNQDTFRNIKAINEFVLNVPNVELLRRVNRTADPVPSNTDEFIHSNLTPFNSKIVKPPSIENVLHIWNERLFG